MPFKNASTRCVSIAERIDELTAETAHPPVIR
jgi:hypothetical protein